MRAAVLRSDLCVAWACVAWACVAWACVAWACVAWACVAWDRAAWDRLCAVAMRSDISGWACPARAAARPVLFPGERVSVRAVMLRPDPPAVSARMSLRAAVLFPA